MKLGNTIFFTCKVFEKPYIELIHPTKNTQRGSGGFDFLEHVTRYTALVCKHDSGNLIEDA